jgi:hypothetical protein
MVARFPGKLSEHPASSNWAWRTYEKAKADPRVSEVLMWDQSDTPITMVRNLCVCDAMELGVDVLLMVDNDMKPDYEEDGQPFWQTSFDFWWQRRHAPMVIGAPYTGPPPNNNIYVFQWDNYNNYQPDKARLPQYPRHQAAIMGGIQRCGALPTGVIAYFNLPMLMRRNASEPGHGLLPVKGEGWFRYEWTDATASRKASTEDVTNTRDIGLVLPRYGIEEAGIYCNWDAWAAHIKPQEFGKPRPMVNGDVSEVFQRAWSNPAEKGDRVMHLDRKFPQVQAVDAEPIPSMEVVA